MHPTHPTAAIDGHTHHLFAAYDPAAPAFTLCGKRVDGDIRRGPVTCRECRDAREIPDGSIYTVLSPAQFDQLVADLRSSPPKARRRAARAIVHRAWCFLIHRRRAGSLPARDGFFCVRCWEVWSRP